MVQARPPAHHLSGSPSPGSPSIDDAEVEKFARLAARWWDPAGEMAPLHQMNPVRLAFLRARAIEHFELERGALKPLAGLRVLDVGCGAGLLCEPLARLGATVTGIDAGDESLEVARRHAKLSELEIDYRHSSVEALAVSGESYDLVTALEVVEHVADVESFLDACATLVRPGGALALSTINRTPQAFAFAILGAEYLLRRLPRGTHDWRKFLKPSELARVLRRQGLRVQRLTGMVYNPLSGEWRLSERDLAINYLLWAGKPEAEEMDASSADQSAAQSLGGNE